MSIHSIYRISIWLPIIIPLGYAYVALAVALRGWLGPQRA